MAPPRSEPPKRNTNFPLFCVNFFQRDHAVVPVRAIYLLIPSAGLFCMLLRDWLSVRDACTAAFPSVLSASSIDCLIPKLPYVIRVNISAYKSKLEKPTLVCLNNMSVRATFQTF
ncbi:hypothetical protein CIPAW_14G101200 [Carya illinoinensis]|uniref:Uncharacterized protein n=1 Tax=Carya illinoinensis TaxID=32201 RepID=A0A8T1NIR1_CARIL|nr:hypothetical protein CIPAW_14G101200 [Carya illinoinensis]